MILSSDVRRSTASNSDSDSPMRKPRPDGARVLAASSPVLSYLHPAPAACSRVSKAGRRPPCPVRSKPQEGRRQPVGPN